MDSKISALGAAAGLTGAELTVLVQSAGNVNATLAILKSFFRPFRGDYSAAGNVFPVSGGTGPSGAIAKGDEFDISVSGTLGGVPVFVGTTIRARQDTPGNTLANWRIFF